MAVSNITSSLISQSLGDQKATQQSSKTTSDPVTNALKHASDRIEQQIGSTKVQLSAYGQIKGAFSEVQAAGRTLSDTKKAATTEDVRKAVTGFVSAFNKANKTVAAATQGAGKQAGALANDARASIAGNDLRRSVTEGNALSDLKKIGITQNKDGSLAVDTKLLDKALQANPDQVRSTVANIGQQVEKTAAQELGDNGNVGRSVNTLSNRSRNLETQQSTQQEQLAAAQRLVDQQTAQLDNHNNGVASGATAYQRTFNA